MAFGFFKKKNTADIVFMNGHIYTQDHEFPWASAAACRDGRVLAVGDFEAMDEIVSEDTEVFDLNGKYMFPGFMEIHGTQILKAFEDQYLRIDPDWDLDTVLEAVGEYAQDTEQEVVFAYGYHERILADYDDPEEVHRLLDEIDADRPVVLLGISGVHCWLNTLAADIIRSAADDQGVRYVSADFILHTLAPLDFAEIELAVSECSDALSDKGITSVFPLGTPDYFSALYQGCIVAMIGESISPKQRIFSSIYLNRPFSPDLVLHKLAAARTNCIELDNLITCDFLHIALPDDENTAEFSQEALNTICLSAAERSCNIRIDAPDAASSEKAASALAFVRSKGCRNNTFILAADSEIPQTDEEMFFTTWPCGFPDESVFSHASSTAEAVDMLTLGAAEMLGVTKDFGSIEQGKRADFTIFEENPLERDLRYFSTMHASMTVIDGEIVYDLETACDDEMYDLLVSMRL